MIIFPIVIFLVILCVVLFAVQLSGINKNQSLEDSEQMQFISNRVKMNKNTSEKSK